MDITLSSNLLLFIILKRSQIDEMMRKNDDIIIKLETNYTFKKIKIKKLIEMDAINIFINKEKFSINF